MVYNTYYYLSPYFFYYPVNEKNHLFTNVKNSNKDSFYFFILRSWRKNPKYVLYFEKSLNY